MSGTFHDVGLLLATALAGAGLAFGIIAGSLPWLRRIALANPNGRSSHKEPTPQGGGLGVMAGTIVLGGGLALTLSGGSVGTWLPLLAGLAGLTLLGFLDDTRPLPWRLKLLVQTGAALVASLGLPFPVLGMPAAIVMIGIATFLLVAVVNFTNFVDGIDEISVAHAVPALVVPIGLMLLGGLTRDYGIVSAAALGALLGFWWWNRHPARIFLGDSGSLPLGLLLGWLAIASALSVHPALGLLISLYPLAEGGMTVLRRLARREKLTEPHRDHAYQRAVDHGIATRTVSRTIAIMGLLGSGLALTGYWFASPGSVPGTETRIGLPLVAVAIVVAPILVWLRKTHRNTTS